MQTVMSMKDYHSNQIHTKNWYLSKIWWLVDENCSLFGITATFCTYILSKDYFAANLEVGGTSVCVGGCT